MNELLRRRNPLPCREMYSRLLAHHFFFGVFPLLLHGWVPFASLKSAPASDLTFHLPSCSEDLLSLSKLTVETFGAQVSMSEGAFSGIRFAEPLAQKGLSLWNAYTNGYAELDVFAGFKSRVGQERLNSPYTGLDSDKSGMHVEANSSLLISVLKGRNVPVAMVELRLQECDGKIPFTQPAIDRLERFVAATLRKKEEFPVRPYLSNLCVAEAYRRKGLGLVLCQVCEDGEY